MTAASDLADELEAAGEGYMRTLKPAWTGDNRDEALALVIVVADNLSEILSALRRVEPGSDQPRPSVSEDQGASRDLALTDGVALDGWQPIETAPRDGTEILIAIGSDYIGSAFYADDDSDPYPWKFFDRNGIKPLANGIRDDRMGPTHWMPLPAPPSSAKPAPDAVPGTNPKTTDKGGE